MRQDITFIDHESGVGMLKALDEMSESDVVESLRNAIKRKLDYPMDTVPEGKDPKSRMERFFDNIVDIAPEEKPIPNEIVIELIDEAIKVLDKDIEDPLSKEYELVEMFQNDKANFVIMKEQIIAGHIAEAIKTYRNMDTAPRGRLFGRNYRENFQLSFWMSQ